MTVTAAKNVIARINRLEANGLRVTAAEALQFRAALMVVRKAK
uniref:Uncharacterized protein n=1 Tax=viral metagenome TaxID=1070528 RepID=A0A6M3LB83_9ZZZZ